MPRVAVSTRGAFLCERLCQLGEAEVEDLHVAGARQEQVLGLEIAMHDAFFVCGGQAARDLHRDLHGLAHRQRPARKPVAQRLSFEQLGDDVRHSFVAAGVVDRKDVRVVQRADGTRFQLEASQPLGVRGQRGGQHLDRDLAAEARIARAVHLAHPSGTERGDDLVGTQTGSCIQGHLVGFPAGLCQDADAAARFLSDGPRRGLGVHK